MIAIALKRDGHETWFFIYVAAILAVSFVVALRCARPRAQPDPGG